MGVCACRALERHPIKVYRTLEGRRLVVQIGQGDVPSPWFPMNGRPPARRHGDDEDVVPPGGEGDETSPLRRVVMSCCHQFHAN